MISSDEMWNEIHLSRDRQTLIRADTRVWPPILSAADGSRDGRNHNNSNWYLLLCLLHDANSATFYVL